MKTVKALFALLCLGILVYLMILFLVPDQCRVDGNPFDCDDDLLGPIVHEVSEMQMVSQLEASSLQTLKNSELSDLLVDRQISNRNIQDRNSEVFTEDFRADGTWSARYELRALLQNSGTWSARGDKICVATQDGVERCRSLYVQRSNSNVRYWIKSNRHPSTEKLSEIEIQRIEQ